MYIIIGGSSIMELNKQESASAVRRLLIIVIAIYIQSKHHLFPDTKLRKNISQHFIIGHFS